MNNRIALTLGFVIVAAIVLDLALFSGENLVFLGKKLFDLTEWMAFWR